MTRDARPFLILQTGRPVASMRRHGSFAHWIRVAAGRSLDRYGQPMTVKLNGTVEPYFERPAEGEGQSPE